MLQRAGAHPLPPLLKKTINMSDKDIVNFYAEKNDLTGLYHWQHMRRERILEILKKITINAKRQDDRAAAASLALEIMKFNLR